MSRESKKEFHQGCNACDFQKLKQLENNPVVRKLRDKIEQLNFRITECRNENQMLKRNLLLAKKLVCKEVGGQDVDFQSLLKFGTESGSKGRQEDILVLKTKVQELKDYLKELEGDPPTPDEATSEENAKYQIPSETKKLWRMELERRLARENAEKDINPLVQECYELRRQLDAEKNRFRELSEERNFIRAELQSQVQKNEEDFGIIQSFKTLEKQLEETLAERAEIRQDLDGARTRNKRLTEERTSLAEELEVLQKKTSDNNKLIDSLTHSHKCIQEAIDAEKIIVQQNAERYKEELKSLQDNHVTDCGIIDHLQCIIHERNSMLDELKKEIEPTKAGQKDGIPDNLKKLPSKKSQTLKPSVSKDKTSKEGENSVEDQTGNTNTPDPKSKIRQLRIECAKYKALCEAAKMESDCLLHLIENRDRKMNEIAVQVVETGRLIMQKNAEKKELLEKVNTLQRSLTAKRRRGKLNVQPKTRLEELRIKCDAQAEENDFLRNFLRSAVCGKAKDLEQFKSFITDNKHFFDASLKEIKELVETDQTDQRNGSVATESTSELEN